MDTGCRAEGIDGQSPYIGTNGNWWIGNEDTGVAAKGEDGKDGENGQDGQDGQNGITPHIGENGNWFIGDEDTGIPARGPQGDKGDTGEPGEPGKDGEDGLTPFIGDNGNWWIGDVDTGVSAKGSDGHTPIIEIGSNGNWLIDGIDTGKKAVGEDGKDGEDGIDGNDGKDGISVTRIEKTSSDGLVDTYTIYLSNGQTYTFTVTNGKDGPQGIQGEPGEDGKTPVINVGSNGNWYVDGEDTGCKAEGVDGNTPYIGENGNWYIADTDTGIRAQGPQGEPGEPGKDGENGITPHIGDNGNWFIGDEDTGICAGYVNETYIVTFFPNGGLLPEDTDLSVEVQSGHYITDLPIPTREGYTFLGWFTGNSVNDGQITLITPVFSDLNLIARWEEGETAAAENDYIYISTPRELLAINNNLDGNYRLAGDISLDGIEWTPIGTSDRPFTGTLDGDGHTISDFNTISDITDIGIFGCASDAIFTNLTIQNVDITLNKEVNNLNIGALICSGNNLGLDNVIIDNFSLTCQANNGRYTIGGLVGTSDGTAKITNCSSINDFTVLDDNSTFLNQDVGGLIGKNLGELTIENCTADGEFNISCTTNDDHYTNPDPSYGGFVGLSEVKAIFNESTNKKNFTFSAYSYRICIGGFLGSANSQIEFNSCENYGDFQVLKPIESLVYVAGFFGGESSGVVKCNDCINYGDITTSDSASVCASGIVGGDCGIVLLNCKNYGNIQVKAASGTLVGQAFGGDSGHHYYLIDGFEGYGNIEVEIKSPNVVGGIVGWIEDGNCIIKIKNSKCSGNIIITLTFDLQYNPILFIGGLIGLCVTSSDESIQLDNCQIENNIQIKCSLEDYPSPPHILVAGIGVFDGDITANEIIVAGSINISSDTMNYITLAKEVFYTSDSTLSLDADTSKLLIYKNNQDITSSVSLNKTFDF